MWWWEILVDDEPFVTGGSETPEELRAVFERITELSAEHRNISIKLEKENV